MSGIVRLYLELIRFSHTLFALPFAILASIWAWLVSAREEVPLSLHWWAFLGILLCMVTARSFAMAINRLADAAFDGANPRTAGRHLPAGRLQRGQVVRFAIGCAIAFLLATLLFLPNRLPILLGIPVLVFIAGYSWAKRWTDWVHFWLGAALGLAPLCAWIALRGERVLTEPYDLLPPLLVGVGVFLWVAGFDIIYACQDADFDRQQGLHSLPARFGIKTALRVAALCHAMMLVPFAAVILVCPQLGLNTIYLGGLILVALVLIYEHWIVSADKLDRVNIAFFHANAIIGGIILVAGTVDAWYV